MTDDDRLLSHVRPPDWRNPTPRPLYDLVVIGGGTAGLVSAAGAAGVGARVALVERSRLGGDCLHSGCVPSKALLRSARVVGDAQAGAGVGVLAVTHPDFGAVMRRLRARRADIAPHDSVERLRSLGVDVFFGHATFHDTRSVTVGDIRLRYRKAVIATGSRPAVPAFAGLGDVPFLTSETVFEIVEQPRTLAVLGGGPVGCELAQAFARLGTRVTVIEAAARVLPREDADAAEVVAQALGDDGVELVTGASVSSVESAGTGVRLLHAGGQVTADALLVATGRVPAVTGLGLDNVGIRWNADGVIVDDRLRTTNPYVFAAGDVASRLQFTHAADAQARMVIRNALFFGRHAASRLVVPWCTFTSPELAHVGLTSAAATSRGAETITMPLTEVDRAVIDDQTNGFVRIHHRRGRILGATIVAHGAGELIGTVTSVMQAGLPLSHFSTVVFPYPTLSVALRQAGDAYQRTRLTPTVRRALQYYFRLWSARS